MSQPLHYDEIEMWHGHPDLYMIKLEEFLNTPDGSDIGFFVEVNLRYPDKTKEKTTNFPFCPENKVIHNWNQVNYQPYFGQENIQLHYIETDAFVLSVNTENIIKDLKNKEDTFDFKILDENHELFSYKNKKRGW